MTVSFWQQRAREPDLACDVAIVGAGIIGCSTAYWLHRLRPSLRVLLLDAGQVASGASGRNAGFLIQGTATDYVTDQKKYGPERAKELWHLTRENRDLLVSELRPEVFHLEASGSMTVAGTREEDERLRASVSPMRYDGASVAYVTAADTNRRLRSQGFFGALYVSSGAMLDSVALVRHLADESKAEVLPHHPVLELDERADQVTLETPVRRVRAAQVVLAMNAYTPKLVPELGKMVRPVRAQMLATAPLLPRWLHVPAYTHEGYFYIRQLVDGTVLLGGARHLHRVKEVGYKDETTPDLQADLEAYLHHYFPQRADVQVVRRWSGVMGFSPDGLPIWGPVPGHNRTLWAGGFTGHGMSFGFRFGMMMAELTMGYTHAEYADLFASTRFIKPPRQAVSKAS